ncbi:hypothetical protein [Desulfosudis oleivorans]|nr:hypothetical protein [Desulfosudis oleivorans]
MKNKLKPWAARPFELIFHAEIHYRKGSDYDRRLALISFDNAIEVSIATYLSLNPLQRGNRQYPKKDIEKWMNNYHSKLDFFALEIQTRGLPEYKEKAEIVWYHDQRNEHYHGGGFGVPQQDTLDGIRQVALWVFSVLFEAADIETDLEAAISESDKEMPSIPDSFIVPRGAELNKFASDTAQAKALTAATMIGKWYESNENDLKIIRKIVDGF